MEEKERYSSVLGLAENAGKNEIERAYAEAASRLRSERMADDPVVRRQAQEKLKEINEAYLALTSDAAAQAAAIRRTPMPPETVEPVLLAGKPREHGENLQEKRGVVKEGSAGTFGGAHKDPAAPVTADLEQKESEDPLLLLRKDILLLGSLFALIAALLLFSWWRSGTGRLSSKPPVAGVQEQGHQPAESAEVALLTRDAEAGNVVAQTRLAYLLLTGAGGGKDVAGAALWFGRAASQGNPEAEDWLGYLYETGQGVKADYLEAVKWYTLSAEQGYPDAEKNLGLMYLKGEGVGQNREKALGWLRKAAAHGLREAQEALAAEGEK